MKQLIFGLIVFGLLCVGVGILCGIIYENIKLNSEIEKKLISNPVIRIGGDIYIISKYNGLDLNDSIIRTVEYPIQ